MTGTGARLAGLTCASALMIPFLGGCSSNDKSTQQSQTAATSAPAPTSAATSAPAPPATFVPVDACSLLTREDVEAIAAKKALAGRKDEVANLVTCSFGDPTAPQAGGQPIGQVLTLAVMTGQEGAYYAGPVAQAKDAYLTGKKNAASVEAVSGVGEDAYWDNILHKLSFVKGKYLVDVSVESDGDRRSVARAAAAKVLERLPR